MDVDIVFDRSTTALEHPKCCGMASIDFLEKQGVLVDHPAEKRVVLSIHGSRRKLGCSGAKEQRDDISKAHHGAVLSDTEFASVRLRRLVLLNVVEVSSSVRHLVQHGGKASGVGR